MRSRIEPLKKMARMLRAHSELLLNYFKANKKFSSGGVEGLTDSTDESVYRTTQYPHLL